MSKKMCKKEGIKLRIKDAKYECKKCELRSNKENKLCKPQKI